MDPSKISEVLRWPIPKSLMGFHGFLGLTGYYCRFICNYGQLPRPLTSLLKKEALHPFKWSSLAHEAFVNLKQAVTFALVLTMPNFSKHFVVECDSSGIGLGAVLMQDVKPLAFYSKTLSSNSLALSAYDRELMALVLVVTHWHIERIFTVQTDHCNLRHLLKAQQHWISKLIGYRFVGINCLIRSRLCNHRDLQTCIGLYCFLRI